MEGSILDKLNQIRQRIEAVSEEKYRVALMYQYLIGGEAGEVSGVNAPFGNDVFLTSIEVQGKKIQVAIFLVKTVRREGNYRVCAIPYDSEYEPWILFVVEWFNKHKETYPFQTSKRASFESNKKYLMNEASKAFKGLKWFKESYTIQGTRQERRWINFTSSQLRDLRHEVLKELYGFNEVDLAYYGAWNDPPLNTQVKLRIERILDNKIDRKDVGVIENIGRSYIEKLLIKNENLGDKDSSRFFDPLNTEYRFERAENITSLIQNINLISNIKLNTNVFYEDMGFVLDIFTPCNNEIKIKSNITNVMNLFEVSLDRYKEIVKNNQDGKLITLFERLLKENGIKYEDNMIKTWRHMNTLRNYFNHPRDADKIERVLNYFDQPIEIPFDPTLLWNKILDQFEDSLYACLNTLNGFNVIFPDNNKVKINLYCDKEIIKQINSKISTPQYRFADRSHFFEQLCSEWLRKEETNEIVE